MSGENGSNQQNTEQRRAQNVRRTTLRAVGLVLFMVGLSFASVPLYDAFCRVTGWGGTTQQADSAPEQMSERTVIVRFDANVNRALPWKFEPVQRQMTVHIGETGLAFYRATNNSDQPITGTAAFNVTPYEVGSYFTKIDCFCFTEQTLQPGETVEMPVTFYVDPEMLDDPERRDTSVITLSYTFYRQDKQAAVAE
ncbi:MAG: cytochrome c oxidase assembly protein [Neomegalonema sp.]|nr:cytochrome c oxidase assembly protein [Neomegalonema sp.]